MDPTKKSLTRQDFTDYFKLGSNVSKIKLQGYATGGIGFLSNIPPEQEPEMPSYKRGGVETRESQLAYTKEPQEEEELRFTQKWDQRREPQALDNISVISSQLEEGSITAGSIVGGNDLAPLNDLYNNYDFTNKPTPDLVIEKYKEQIISTINANQVIIIEGSTGSGKTTQVPNYILNHYVEKKQFCNIIVTQPRKIAAISIAKRVCSERRWAMGTVVGYQVGMDNTTTEDTRLTYVTTGVLLQKLIHTKHMNDFTHVILDEVHERDIDMDFALLVVKKMLMTNSPTVKVILMSATFDIGIFSDYFSLSAHRCLWQPSVISVEGRSHEVNDYYIDLLSSLGPIPDFDPYNPTITLQTLQIAQKLILRLDNIEVSEQKKKDERGFAEKRGAVLVFLPGIQEIQDFNRILHTFSIENRWWILPLHSTITIEEQQEVFKKPPRSQRKIILSTNIAESSITVPDIIYVIDFCLTKCLTCDEETNYPSLRLEWASKANCMQRRGRAGRVAPGRCYRMVPSKFYQQYFAEFGTPEMRRCPLELTILKTKLLDMGEPKNILALAMEPPLISDIERSILLLKQVGGLAATVGEEKIWKPYDGDLTFIGRVMSALPVDVRIGKLIVLGHIFGCLEECIIIGAGMSLQSFFAKPFNEQLRAYKTKMAWADGCFSDCILLLNTYKVWKERTNEGRFRTPGGQTEKEWAKQYFIQLRRLMEIDALVKDLTHRLDRYNILPYGGNGLLIKDPFTNILILQLVIAGAFYPNYFIKNEVDELDANKTLSGFNPYTTVVLSGLPDNQGILYYHAVQEMFKDCGRNLKLHFEGSKAFVEFLKSDVVRPEQKTDVSPYIFLPPVYLAIKMRQLRTNLAINVLPSEEASKRMKELTKEPDEDVRSSDPLVDMRSLKNNRMTLGNRRSPLQKVELPGLDKTVVDITITHIVNCSIFYARYGDGQSEMSRQLRELESKINENGGAHLQPLHDDILTPGDFVLAPFSSDHQYYRARVETVTSNGVYVHFVDWGNTVCIQKHMLKCLEDSAPSFLLKTPAMAFECSLAGLKPAKWKEANGTWCPEAMKSLTEIVEITRGRSRVKTCGKIYSVVHDVVRIELMIVDESRRSNSVNDLFIKKGWAEPAEESYFSKQNHDFRVRESQTGSFYDSPHLVSEERLVDAEMLRFLTSSTDNGLRSKVAYLKGPHHPLEMTFYNLTRLGSIRQVTIDRDSINAVALDTEPQEKYMKMMVAGLISSNPTGSSLTARSTTFLPHIRGLPSILCLVFSPCAQLRTDFQRKQYTGMICGLGADIKTNKPLFPDHDIELSFDTEFTIDDLVSVNTIRFAINQYLGPDRDALDWDRHYTETVQNKVREQLRKLVAKPRASITPKLFPRAYCWNQVKPEHLLEPTTDAGYTVGTQLLSWVCGVTLNR